MTKMQEAKAEDIKIDVLNVINDNGINDIEAAAKSEEQGGYGIPQNDSNCVISEDMAGTILKTPFEVAAAFLGDHWKLSKGEVDLMAPPASRVFSELFGQWAGQYPDAYMLGFSLIVAVAPRAAQTAQDRKTIKRDSNILHTENDFDLEDLSNAN